MRPVRIITDSASDITTVHRDDFTVMPMAIQFGENTYLDGVTIDHKTFYEKLIESDELPKTSLISPGAFSVQFAQCNAHEEDVVVITMSSKLSGTCQSARIAAAEYDNIYVIDSENATVGEQILVLYALRLADEGLDAATIAAKVEESKERVHILGIVDTLEYLQKGGRLSVAAAMLGGVFSIKPVLTVSEGEVKIIGKARGSKNGNNFIVKEIEKANGVDFSMPVVLGYSGISDDLLQKYIADSASLWEGYTEQLQISSIGATIGTHVGPGAIAVAFFAK